MNRGRTSVRSPLATYSIHSTSYTSPAAASYSLHTPSFSPHITSYTSKGNLYPYHGKSLSSNESIRTNSNGDNRTPQVLTLPLTFANPRSQIYPRYPRYPRYILDIPDIPDADAKKPISGPSFGEGGGHHEAAD